MSWNRGAPIGGGGMSFAFPPVTPMIRRILWTLGIAFALQWIVLYPFLGRWTVDRWLALTPAGVLHGYAWQLVTYALLHGGLWHLLMNMLGIWMFGGDVERLFGSRRLLVYFVVCVVGGGLAHVLVGLLVGNPVGVIGASGGVLGIVLAFALFYPDRMVFIFPLPFPIRARTMALIYMVLDLWGAVSAAGGGIAHFAHLGGALAGFLYIGWWRGWGPTLAALGIRRRRRFRVVRDDRDPWH